MAYLNALWQQKYFTGFFVWLFEFRKVFLKAISIEDSFSKFVAWKRTFCLLEVFIGEATKINLTVIQRLEDSFLFSHVEVAG